MDARWRHRREVCEADMILRSTGFSPTSLESDNPVIGWHSLVTATNIRSTTADSDFPAANMATAATHLKWKSGVNTGSEVIEIELGGATVDYVAIAKHNFATTGSSITVEGTADTSSPYTGFATLLSATTVTDDLPLIIQFASQTLGVVRITVTSASDI